MTFYMVLTAVTTVLTYVLNAHEDARPWIVAIVVVPALILGAILGTPPAFA